MKLNDDLYKDSNENHTIEDNTQHNYNGVPSTCPYNCIFGSLCFVLAKIKLNVSICMKNLVASLLVE